MVFLKILRRRRENRNEQCSFWCVDNRRGRNSIDVARARCGAPANANAAKALHMPDQDGIFHNYWPNVTGWSSFFSRLLRRRPCNMSAHIFRAMHSCVTLQRNQFAVFDLSNPGPHTNLACMIPFMWPAVSSLPSATALFAPCPHRLRYLGNVSGDRGRWSPPVNLLAWTRSNGFGLHYVNTLCHSRLTGRTIL